MLVIHGTKLVRKVRGELEHCCPVCRDMRRFRVVSVASVSHVNYIPTGRRKPVATEYTCGECGVLLGILPWEGDAAADGGDVASPWEAEQERQEQAMNRRAREGRLDEDERAWWILHPFIEMEYMAQQRARTGRQQSLNAIIQLAAIVGFVATLISWWSMLSNRHPPTRWDWGWCVGSTLWLILTGVWVYRRSRSNMARAVRIYLIDLLARSLGELRPPITAEEFQGALVELMARDMHGSSIAKAVDPGELWERISRRA